MKEYQYVVKIPWDFTPDPLRNFYRSREIHVFHRSSWNSQKADCKSLLASWDLEQKKGMKSSSALRERMKMLHTNAIRSVLDKKVIVTCLQAGEDKKCPAGQKKKGVSFYDEVFAKTR